MEIEYANCRSRVNLTLEEVRAKVRESQEFWSSPAGQAEQRRLDERNAKREYRGIKFPHLAGTAPALVTRSAPATAAPAPRVAGWKRLFEIIS
jgi:hypothetical protein